MRRADVPQAVAPILIREMTSVCTVTFKNLNLSGQLAGDHNALLLCFGALVSDQHRHKVRSLILENVTIDSIFEAERFCKKFVN